MVDTSVLMASMGVITLTACYVGWRFAKDAEGYYKALDMCRDECDECTCSLNQWLVEHDEAQAEAKRLSGHVEILQDLCADIHAYTSRQKSGTAQKVARMAKAGLAK